jgi:uncharacterized protein YkwD
MKRNFLYISLFLFASLVSFSPDYNESLVDDVLSYTNKFRKSKGKTALTMREDLNEIAQKHSENMAKGRVGFGHNGFSKREGQVRKIITGASRFAENVAYGSTSGKDVVEGWKNSSGHRKNMLGAYKYIGIGIAKDRRGVIYYTQIFVD